MREEGTTAYAVHMQSDFPGVAWKLLVNIFLGNSLHLSVANFYS